MSKLKPEDYIGTMTREEAFPGRKVMVRAWWTATDDLVPCEVVKHYTTDEFYMTVKPLVGNNHQRQIDRRTIVS